MAGTTIGANITVDGEIRGEEVVTVLGAVKGKIATSENVLIESSAAVDADVEGKQVVVSGKVTGNVIAQERLEVKTDGRLVGDVRAARIVIADGASFKGNVDMDV